MSNPFKIGEVVKGEYFCNRRQEIETLLGYIEGAQNVFIYSPRRFGKTSLIKVVLEEAVRLFDAVTVYVDVQRATSPAQFVEVYSAAISEAFLTRKEKIERIAAIFRRVVPSFEFDEDGSIRMSFDFSRTRRGLERAEDEVYNLPQNIAESSAKRVVVVFDEFQEIASFDGKAFEKRLRSYIQHHSDVCYVFMGSRTHVIVDMFSDAGRAFYKSALVFPLHPIPETEMVSFLEKRFVAGGKQISNKLARETVDISRNIPYYVQMLSSYVWLRTVDVVGHEDIKNGIEDILKNQNELFTSWFESLTMHQRAVLKALAHIDEIFSNDTRQEHSLGSAASVQTSLKALIKNALVVKEDKRYVITDPFFEAWLER